MARAARGKIPGWLWVAGALLLARGRRAHATTHTEAHGHRTPSGPEWPLENHPSYPATRAGRCAFARDMLEVVQRVGGLSRRAAILVIAHFARETAYGHAAYNFNMANVKQFDSLWPGAPWHRLAGEPFRAFATVEDGVRAMLDVIDSRGYADAWRELLAGDVHWYSQLGLHGYYEYRPRDPVTGRRLAAQRHTEETVRIPQRDYEAFLRVIEGCLAGA